MALAIDQRADGAGKDGCGVGEHASPITGVMAAVAQFDVEMDSEAPAATQEDRWAFGRKPRPVGGDEYIGGKLVAMGRADLRQLGRSDFFAHLDDELGVEAEPPAASLMNGAQRRQIDRMLPLVVGAAAAVNAIAFRR